MDIELELHHESNNITTIAKDDSYHGKKSFPTNKNSIGINTLIMPLSITKKSSNPPAVLPSIRTSVVSLNNSKTVRKTGQDETESSTPSPTDQVCVSPRSKIPSIRIGKSPEKIKSDEIEKYLKEEKKKYAEYCVEPKILILGSSDSGKSTLLKQLKILHGNGFTAEERLAFKKGIIKNILTAVLATGIVIRDGESIVHLSDDDLGSNVTSLSHITSEASNGMRKETSGVKHELYEFGEQWRSNSVIPLPDHISKCLIDLWKDEANQKIFYDDVSKFFPDTTEHFLQSIERCLDKDYEPTDVDILKLRQVTMSVSDNLFKVDNTTMHFYDVSGLKHHRKMWLPYFDNVHSVLFVASLASYDKQLVEDPTVNQMSDALVLFDSISNNLLLSKIDFILFLNKKDLFEKKIAKIPIQPYFPMYKGGNSAKSGIKFFKGLFVSQKSGARPSVHVTCCTDTQTMKVIVESIVMGIVTNNLEHFGLVH